MRIGALVVLAVAALAATGCRNTMDDVFKAKTSGRSAVYPVTPAKAWEVSGDVLWEATQEYPENHPDIHFMCVKGGMGTDEAYIGVWCEPQDDPNCSRVTVVVRRISGLQVAVVMTEEQFHNLFAEAANVKRLP